MRQTSAVLAIALLFTLASCSDAVVEPALHEVADAEQMYASKSKGKVLTFTAPLSGRQEVPSNDSRATGNAVFQLSKDGTELSYKLIVANIQNVTMAHIHLAPAGANGPVVLWLYPSSPPAQLIAGRSQGILAEGTVTAGDLVGPLAGQALSALVDHLQSGGAYVNVHTSQFPPGEIRGQIK
jgi:hypothetical protein